MKIFKIFICVFERRVHDHLVWIDRHNFRNLRIERCTNVCEKTERTSPTKYYDFMEFLLITHFRKKCSKSLRYKTWSLKELKDVPKFPTRKFWQKNCFQESKGCLKLDISLREKKSLNDMLDILLKFNKNKTILKLS